MYVCVYFREEKGLPVDSSSAAGSANSSNLQNTSRQNTVNMFNGLPYSQKYHTLYRKRITLPVFEYRADFMRLLAEHQCIVLVGETGSGKTTQIPQWYIINIENISRIEIH